MKSYTIRIFYYILGFFIMTIGIAFSVKSDLGVSPVSSIPYTITCVTGMEMGNATILFHCGLVVLQILILGKCFKWKNLMQIPVGIIFGKFTTICNFLVGMLPTPDDFYIKVAMLLCSIFFLALGIFFYMPANIMPLAGEGAMQAVSQKTGFKFSKVKVGFDVSMVVISLVVCLICLGKFGSVGVGTIISAFLVGTVLGLMNRFWRHGHLVAKTA